jgi:hypothetical protein
MKIFAQCLVLIVGLYPWAVAQTVADTAPPIQQKAGDHDKKKELL